MNHLKKRKTATYYEWCKIAHDENPIMAEMKHGGVRNRNIYNAMILMKRCRAYKCYRHVKWPPARIEVLDWRFKGTVNKKYRLWT